MFKFFFKLDENVSETCYKSKRQFNRGFRQGAMRAYAQGMLHKLKKATPRSDRTTEHAADDWEIKYNKAGVFITGFEVDNPHDRIDWIEYGTERPKKKLQAKQIEEGKSGDRIYPKKAKALHFFVDGIEIYAASVKGSKIAPMGFVREVQDELDNTLPSWLRKEFNAPIEKRWK